MITQERLKELLHYDPLTGVFTRLVATSNSVKVGDVAGNISAGGYRVIGVCGKQYLAHRLAWLYMKGDMPKDQVDHINGVRVDNSWANLRGATDLTNQKNTSISKNNKSGVVGVSWSKTNNKWRAIIWDNKKKIHLGYFKDIADAALERLEAENEYGYHKNHGRNKAC